MSIHEETMSEVMKMTDWQKYEVSKFAKVPRLKDARDTTAMMEFIVTENEEAFRKLAK